MKKNLIITSLNGYYNSTSQILKASENYDDVETVAVNDLAYGIKDDEPFLVMPDGEILHQGDPDLPDWAILHMAAPIMAECLERLGITCFSSPEMVHLAQDKVRSALLMSKAFPVPDSLFFKGNMELPASESFMVKAAVGNQGNQVWKIDDLRMVCELEHLLPSKTHLIFQELMPSADDVRVYMLGNDVVCAVKRSVPSGVWKSNLSESPTREEYELDDGQRAKIAEAVKLLPENKGFFTLDFLFNEHGEHVFCEMNTSPGTDALRVLGKDVEIADRYIEYAREKTRKQTI